MKIVYTEHLKFRLKVRRIPFDYPRIIVENPDMKFFDLVENRRVAIRKLKYSGGVKNIMVAYDLIGDVVEVVTIHPISDEKILNRILCGRWR